MSEEACPRCESEKTEKRLDGKMHCLSCGYRWTPKYHFGFTANDERLEAEEIDRRCKEKEAEELEGEDEEALGLLGEPDEDW